MRIARAKFVVTAVLVALLGTPAVAASKRRPASRGVVKAKKPVAGRSRVRIPKPFISAKARAEANAAVFQNVADAASIPVENAAAMIPFFEQLYRHQSGEMQGPVRILHYGDSHTAADEWTGALRAHFQGRFGDGGSGYSFAGRPYSGYRRLDIRSSGSSRGWHTDGLVGQKAGDGIYGLGGVSISTERPHESVFLDTDAAVFELFYYQQPGGGSLQVFDNGTPVERISTQGDARPGYYRLDAAPGAHRFEVETMDKAPVRLFGWVSENATGITYESMGINGAQASIFLNWNGPTLQSNVARRDPALIVLAYGTNEAGIGHWTLESYREMFSKLIAEFRAAAPAATILVIGPPDRQQRSRKGWVTLDQMDMIVEAQRQAAYAAGCPFWDMRAKMGGRDAMEQWVAGGMAQYDHVHFTAPGYRLLGDAIFRDVMSQYELFLKARSHVIAEVGPHLPVAGN